METCIHIRVRRRFVVVVGHAVWLSPSFVVYPFVARGLLTQERSHNRFGTFTDTRAVIQPLRYVHTHKSGHTIASVVAVLCCDVSCNWFGDSYVCLCLDVGCVLHVWVLEC